MSNRNLFIIIIILSLISGVYISGCKDGKGGKEKITVQKKYNKTGKVVSEISVKDGLKHGPTRNYYEDGKLHSVVNYEEGKQHGESIWYYENGKPYQVTPYVLGKQNGIQKKYYESGKLMAEIPYRDGEQQPGMKEYTETGNLVTSYPEIVFEKPEKTGSPNRFAMKIHLSNNSKEVAMHQRIISNAGDTLMAAVPITDGIGEITFFVEKGGSTDADITIVAKTKTRLRNNYVTDSTYHVRIVN
jgi:hypothetical protein